MFEVSTVFIQQLKCCELNASVSSKPAFIIFVDGEKELEALCVRLIIILVSPQYSIGMDTKTFGAFSFEESEKL